MPQTAGSRGLRVAAVATLAALATGTVQVDGKPVTP